MIQILLGKEYYSKQQEMCAWLGEHVGRGAWAFHLEPEKDFNWTMASAFGNTQIYFRNEEDLTMFCLVWTKNGSDHTIRFINR